MYPIVLDFTVVSQINWIGLMYCSGSVCTSSKC